MDLKTIFPIVRVPLILLTALTCIGVLINFLDNFLIIAGWWGFVILLCAVCAIWAGYQSASKKLSTMDSIISGAIVWIVPGSVGLFISGINTFINALLWGALEGYEVLAFFGGFLIIIVFIVIGAVLFGILGYVGSFIKTFIKK
ncbi:MAG: hypothetical protein ABH842_01930 [Candidatus Micrarchaeota archaeon]